MPTASETRKPSIASSGPKGVGGWLWFFCVGLVAGAPANSIRTTITDWGEFKAVFDAIPSIRIALIWEIFALSLWLIYGIYCGYVIWFRGANARVVAKRYLPIRFFSFVGIELISILLIGDAPAALHSDFVLGALLWCSAEFFWCLIWWFYFKKSKRVRNTYGDELRHAEDTIIAPSAERLARTELGSKAQADSYSLTADEKKTVEEVLGEASVPNTSSASGATTAPAQPSSPLMPIIILFGMSVAVLLIVLTREKAPDELGKSVASDVTVAGNTNYKASQTTAPSEPTGGTAKSESDRALHTARIEARDEALRIYPSAISEKTPLGKMIIKVFDEWRASSHPNLSGPNAPAPPSARSRTPLCDHRLEGKGHTVRAGARRADGKTQRALGFFSARQLRFPSPAPRTETWK